MLQSQPAPASTAAAAAGAGGAGARRSRVKEFGQKSSRTRNIKNVLHQYLEGTQIFRELMQNADDARATRIAFVVDLRTDHPADKLVATGGTRGREQVAALQRAPALLVFNDRPFSEEDFEAIRKLGDSDKARSTNKIGQWGLGFTRWGLGFEFIGILPDPIVDTLARSVYHLTDFPGAHAQV
eukprot:tig00000361_g24364.t1